MCNIRVVMDVGVEFGPLQGTTTTRGAMDMSAMAPTVPDRAQRGRLRPIRSPGALGNDLDLKASSPEIWEPGKPKTPKRKKKNTNLEDVNT